MQTQSTVKSTSTWHGMISVVQVILDRICRRIVRTLDALFKRPNQSFQSEYENAYT